MSEALLLLGLPETRAIEDIVDAIEKLMPILEYLAISAPVWIIFFSGE